MTVMLRPIVVIGCGGHGRVVSSIAWASEIVVAGFLDDGVPDASPRNLLGPIRETLPKLISTHRFVVALGDTQQRRELSEFVLALGGELATLIHPSAIIAPDVVIGCGTVVMAGVIINTGSSIGRFAVINTRSSIDHDNVIEDNVQVAPGCTLAGRVTCRKDAFIGAGATIVPRIEIGEGAYVAAGAVVIGPVRDGAFVAGCPAIEKQRR